ncbi:MAG: molybdopterin-dependent oxidoreductase, partial [Deltaproteobacteria bacterium]|nr:molybdopterin-dependent oxidoreductase [Deltaproteobacteria bacterium]
EDLLDKAFVREQTDLPMLVRKDTGKYLRESDLKEGGREDQLYWLDEKTGKVVPAPLGTLDAGAVVPALSGTATATLVGGETVEAEPVMTSLRQLLDSDYTPEKASAICGTNPELIRSLGRKVAAKKTHLLLGWNSAKFYHGDLMERAMCLLLALTGNWGKQGTGTRGWNETADAKHIFWGRREATEDDAERVEGTINELNERILERDPTLTQEMVSIERERILGSIAGYAPPIFYWHTHAGYDKVWENQAWSEPGMKRPFSEYWDEAIAKGWWTGYTEPTADHVPQVLVGVAGSTVRRTRGGQKQLLGVLWPKVKLIVSVDPRMSQTCRHSDIVLPPAWFYERADFRFFTPSVTFNTFTDEAVKPLGDTKTEWEMFGLLAGKIGEVAKRRGLDEFRRKREITKTMLDLLPAPLQKAHKLLGDDLFQQAVELALPGLSRSLRRKGKYSDLYKEYTFGGQITEKQNEKVLEMFVADSVREGFFPKGTTLQTYRDKGIVRMVGLGKYDPVALNVSADVKPDKTLNPLTWHTEKKIPYPTYSRRAQFFIDHPWFIEAGEALPVHKDNPAMGGNYPLAMLSGHQRWSIHSIWITNDIILRAHRGKPTLFINPGDAGKRGIKDNDRVRVFNDYAEFHVDVAVGPSVQPGEVIIYHAYEPYQFPGGKSYDVAIPGMIKYLHMAGGYGHLNFWRWNWQPTQADRATRVEMEKA